MKFTLKLSERNFYKIVHAINVENIIQSTTKNLQIINNVEYYNFPIFYRLIMRIKKVMLKNIF